MNVKRRTWAPAIAALGMSAALAGGLAITGDLPLAHADNRAQLRRDNSRDRQCDWDPVNYWVQRCEVWSDAMKRKIRVQIQPSKYGGSHALYLLDGMRARNDWNGWSRAGGAPRTFVNSNVTLVMPVGGESSFYTDWKRPSSSNGQKYTYKWETFLTKELPGYLNRRFGVAYWGNSIGGLSMSGSAAFILALYNRNYFSQALSFSGYMNISEPRMQRALQYAANDAGKYNLQDMWGPYSDPRWRRNDPYIHAKKMRGLSIFMSSCTGLPGRYDDPRTPEEAKNTTIGFTLEAVARQQHLLMKERLDQLHIQTRHVFMANGIHNWPYWRQQLRLAYPLVERKIG